MSYMNVCGKIYHCIECGAHLTIDYNGGTRPTFIGDLEIFRQRALAEKYKNIINGTTKAAGTKTHSDMALYYNNYLHDEAICEKCYKNKDYPQELINEFEELFSALNSIISITSTLVKNIQSIKNADINKFIANLKFEDLRKVDENCFNLTFKTIKKPFKKMISSFIEQTGKLIPAYVKNNIAPSPAIEEEYAAVYPELSKNLSLALSKSYLCGKRYYTYKNICMPENLHYLLNTPLAVREPLAQKEPVYFYYEQVLTENEFNKIVCSAEKISILNASEPDVNIIRLFQAKAKEFCK